MCIISNKDLTHHYVLMLLHWYCVYLQRGMPARMKGIHVYNEPSFFDLIFAMFSPFMSQKLLARVSVSIV